jgi:hypothetical protein
LRAVANQLRAFRRVYLFGFAVASDQASDAHWLVHALGLEKAGDGGRATLQSGAVGFREGVLLFALAVDGPYDLPLRALHHGHSAV